MEKISIGRFALFAWLGTWGIRLLFILVVVVGVCAVQMWQTARWGVAECLRWQAEVLSERFLLSGQQDQELRGMIQEAAQGIEDGRLDLRRGLEVLRALYQGPVLSALMHTGFVRLFDAAVVSGEKDLANIEQTSRRFFQGVNSGGISRKDWERVKEALMEEKIGETVTRVGFVIPERMVCLRKKIGLLGLYDCLSVMEQANRHAVLEDGGADLEPGHESRRMVTGDLAK